MANLQCNAVSSCRVGHHLLPIMCASRRRGLICFTSSTAFFPTAGITWALFSALFVA